MDEVLRHTQIRNIHEMGDVKRAQELPVDEFSVKKGESHDTTQKRTSQIQELQEMVNCTKDSGEFQEIESNYSAKNSLVPSQLTVVTSPRC